MLLGSVSCSYNCGRPLRDLDTVDENRITVVKCELQFQNSGLILTYRAGSITTKKTNVWTVKIRLYIR